MKQLSSSFPDTVAVKNKGPLLEFCPDGTCDEVCNLGQFVSGHVEGLCLLVLLLGLCLPR